VRLFGKGKKAVWEGNEDLSESCRTMWYGRHLVLYFTDIGAYYLLEDYFDSDDDVLVYLEAADRMFVIQGGMKMKNYWVENGFALNEFAYQDTTPFAEGCKLLWYRKGNDYHIYYETQEITRDVQLQR